jgi:hypothetical protein
MNETPRLGATVLGDSACRFLVWAPLATSVEVHLLTPADRSLPLTAGPRGYFRGIVDGVPPGARYRRGRPPVLRASPAQPCQVTCPAGGAAPAGGRRSRRTSLCPSTTTTIVSATSTIRTRAAGSIGSTWSTNWVDGR